MGSELDKKISEVMRPIHERGLRQLIVTWGTLMRAGLEIAKFAKEECMDDNNILYGEDADNFVDNMIKAETEPLSKEEKKLVKEIKETNFLGTYFTK